MHGHSNNSMPQRVCLQLCLLGIADFNRAQRAVGNVSRQTFDGTTSIKLVSYDNSMQQGSQSEPVANPRPITIGRDQHRVPTTRQQTETSSTHDTPVRTTWTPSQDSEHDSCFEPCEEFYSCMGPEDQNPGSDWLGLLEAPKHQPQKPRQSATVTEAGERLASKAAAVAGVAAAGTRETAFEQMKQLPKGYYEYGQQHQQQRQQQPDLTVSTKSYTGVYTGSYSARCHKLSNNTAAGLLIYEN